jgi:hypothetical protein
MPWDRTVRAERRPCNGGSAVPALLSQHATGQAGEAFTVRP